MPSQRPPRYQSPHHPSDPSYCHPCPPPTIPCGPSSFPLPSFLLFSYILFPQSILLQIVDPPPRSHPPPPPPSGVPKRPCIQPFCPARKSAPPPWLAHFQTFSEGARLCFQHHAFPASFHILPPYGAQAPHLSIRRNLDCRPTLPHHQHSLLSITRILSHR